MKISFTPVLRFILFFSLIITSCKKDDSSDLKNDSKINAIKDWYTSNHDIAGSKVEAFKIDWNKIEFINIEKSVFGIIEIPEIQLTTKSSNYFEKFYLS